MDSKSETAFGVEKERRNTVTFSREDLHISIHGILSCAGEACVIYEIISHFMAPIVTVCVLDINIH